VLLGRFQIWGVAAHPDPYRRRLRNTSPLALIGRSVSFSPWPSYLAMPFVVDLPT